MKTPGQAAYAADCKRRPTYHDGSPRKEWARLPAIARESWERSAPDPDQERIDRMTDQELRRIYLQPGRLGERAFLALSARNLARRPFHLK